jgi:6-phosphogluconolactonase
MLSGGSTPIPLFEKLSYVDIAWQNVRVGLCDERWIDTSLKDSNEHLVKQYLLQNYAKKATFIGMYESKDIKEAELTCNDHIKELLYPFDVVVLGMGNDGHTASLFPHNMELKKAFSTTNLCISMVPQDAPYERMSLTLGAILSAKHVFLHFEGSQKLAVYQKAVTCNDAQAMPVSAVLQQNKKDIEVYYR